MSKFLHIGTLAFTDYPWKLQNAKPCGIPGFTSTEFLIHHLKNSHTHTYHAHTHSQESCHGLVQLCVCINFYPSESSVIIIAFIEIFSQIAWFPGPVSRGSQANKISFTERIDKRISFFPLEFSPPASKIYQTALKVSEERRTRFFREHWAVGWQYIMIQILPLGLRG